MESDDFRPRAGVGNLMVAGAGLRLKWRPELESGHALIDAQHRSLWNLANRLADAVDAQSPQRDVAAIVGQILAEIEVHFESEEEAMRLAGYTETARHAELHRVLLEEAKALAGAVAEGVEASYFCDFLMFGLIVGHILGEDRKYFGRLTGPAS